MLRRLHNHIFASKLKEVFDSPLVLVYQTLGHVDHLGLKQQLQAGLARESLVKDAQVKVCHMKNTVAAATGDSSLARLFTNSNLLVGFKLPQDQQRQQVLQPPVQQQQQQHIDSQEYQELFEAATQKIKQDMSPQQAIGGLLGRQQPGPHIPQPALKAFVETGVQLPSEQPLVLIGAFYKCAATPLARLKQWVKLDASQVYGELLGVLDSPVTELLAIEACAEELLACFDDAGGAAVAELLDYKASTAPPGEAQ